MWGVCLHMLLYRVPMQLNMRLSMWTRAGRLQVGWVSTAVFSWVCADLRHRECWEWVWRGSCVVYVCKSEHVLIPLGSAGARTAPPQCVRERQGQAVCASPSLTSRVTSGRSSGPQPPPPETGMIIAVTSTLLPGPARSKSMAQRMHFRNVSCYHHAGVGGMVPCLPWGPRTLRRAARTKVSLCLALPCAFPGGSRSLAHSNQRAVLEL